MALAGLSFSFRSANSALPVYHQIRDALVERLLRGEFKEGDTLPSARLIATELQVSLLTVQHTFKLLSEQHIIVCEKGRGSKVKNGALARLQQENKDRFLAHDWPHFKMLAEKLGYHVSLTPATAAGGPQNTPEPHAVNVSAVEALAGYVQAASLPMSTVLSDRPVIPSKL